MTIRVDLYNMEVELDLSSPNTSLSNLTGRIDGYDVNYFGEATGAVDFNGIELDADDLELNYYDWVRIGEINDFKIGIEDCVATDEEYIEHIKYEVEMTLEQYVEIGDAHYFEVTKEMTVGEAVELICTSSADHILQTIGELVKEYGRKRVAECAIRESNS